MNKYKVCVYAITKNEEQFVDRWMDAVSEADMVIVTDTGSTDQTVSKLRKRGAIVYENKIEPWRFDVARNIAMSYIPDDVDICVSNDLDEVFEPGWRQKLEREWKPYHTRAKYRFTWSYFSDGKPNKQFTMEKIHRRKDFKWIHPVHEVLHYSGEDTDRSIYIHDIVLNHYPDLSKPRSQYLPLLELSATENPLDDRTIFWLGREYMYYKKYDACIETLQRHLALPTAKWNEERCASMRFIARCYLQKEELEKAKSWLYKAIGEAANVREPYLDMVKVAYKEKNWSLMFAMVEKAFEIQTRSESYLLEPEAWGSALYDYGAIASYHLGFYEKAYLYASAASMIEPENERLKKNLEQVRKAYEKI